MMDKLEQLKLKYEELGTEITRLEESEYNIVLPKLPDKLNIIYTKKRMNFMDALTWCISRGGRLPSKPELQLLACCFDLPDELRGPYFWSSNEVNGWNYDVWRVNLINGATGTECKTNCLHAICVLGGSYND
jgi:hypothetical protein